MCRNIKTLFNFEPPATDEEIYAASLQFIPVVQVAAIARTLIESLETSSEPRVRASGSPRR